MVLIGLLALCLTGSPRDARIDPLRPGAIEPARAESGTSSGVMFT
jgi:hypothetical protein